LTKPISRLLDTFGDRSATQRMVQATISAFFSFCEERYGIAHPCRHMKRRGGARERERFLSDDELRRALPVRRELGYPRGDVMLFSLLTGRRLREVTDMTWSEVDLVARVHHLPASRSKNRKAPTVPGSLDTAKDLEKLAPRPRLQGALAPSLRAVSWAEDL
jgi:integrase